jgi:hypothetical protein
MLQWDRLTVPLEISGTRQQDSRPRDAVKLTATEESKTQLQNLPKWITRTVHPIHSIRARKMRIALRKF